MFLNFKDSSDIIDTYENTLQQLSDETPLIQKSMQKLQDVINDFNKLNEEGLKGNINYDRQCYERETLNMAAIQQEYDALIPKIEYLKDTVHENSKMRHEVNSKKFTDPHFVASEL